MPPAISIPIPTSSGGLTVERERGENIQYGTADPSIFSEDGGPSRAEVMGRLGSRWRPADNTRVGRNGAMGGWDELRQRLVGVEDRPMLYVFSTCRDLIRTLPSLQHDNNRPEDVDTDGEDHIADEVRYACLSRPWTRGKPVSAPQHDRWQKNKKDEDSWRTV
jgi:hypothetical protein